MRSRNVGPLPRRKSPSERRRREERDEKYRARNAAPPQRCAMPPLSPRASRTQAVQNRQNVSPDAASKPLAEVKTSLDPTKDRVSKDGNVAVAPQSNSNTTGNRRDNPAKPSDSNLEKPSTDRSVSNAQPKAPNLLKCTVAPPRKVPPLLYFAPGRQFPVIELSRPNLLPRPPLLSAPHPASAFPRKQPLFPISPYYSPLRQSTRWPRNEGGMAWKLRSPPQMMRPSGNDIR